MDIAQACKIFVVQSLESKCSANAHLILSFLILSSLFIVELSIGMNKVFSYLKIIIVCLPNFPSLNIIVKFSPSL